MTKLLIDGHIYNDNEWTCMNVKDSELSIELQRSVDSPMAGITGRMPWRFSSDLVKAPALQREVLAALRLDDIFNPRTVMFRAARDAIKRVFNEAFGEVFDFPQHVTPDHKDAASITLRLCHRKIERCAPLSVFNWDMDKAPEAWTASFGGQVIESGPMPRISHRLIGTTPELCETPPTRETVRDAIIVAVREVESIVRRVESRRRARSEQKGTASISAAFVSPIPGEVVDISPDQ